MAAATSTGLKIFNETSSYLPPLPALRDFIKMYQLDAKKALSQNYLMDLNLTRKIVRKSGNLNGAFVLEVGPGPGGITRAVLDHPCQRVDVVELDKQFIRPLERLQDHGQGRLHIHHGDILKTDIHQIWKEAGATKSDWMDDDPPFQIIGNLPFHISIPLLVRLCKQISMRQGPFQFGRIPMTFTFQSEVAKRIIAPLDCKQRSRFGINCQNFTEPKILFEIPGKCFTPRPEINVCAVNFKPRVEPRIPTHYELTEKVVRTIFHFRRKYLRKAVKLLYPKEMANEKADNLLKHCRLNSSMNAPSLGVEDFAEICLFYERQCKENPGLYHFDHRRPAPIEQLAAAHPNPFPPKYKKPVDALQKIEEGGISLSEFDAAFMDKNRNKWQWKETRRKLEDKTDGRENGVKEKEILIND